MERRVRCRFEARLACVMKALAHLLPIHVLSLCGLSNNPSVKQTPEHDKMRRRRARPGHVAAM